MLLSLAACKNGEVIAHSEDSSDAVNASTTDEKNRTPTYG